MADKSTQELLDGLMRDAKRAAELGLIPQSGAKISGRGDFIVHPSNIEDDENAKMRGYRHKEYPKHLHGWGIDETNLEAGPLFVEVRNKDEDQAALAAGWSLEPLHGPRGKLSEVAVVEEAAAVEEVTPRGPVRTFAPPGALRPSPKADAPPKGHKPSKTKAKAPKADAPPAE